MRSPVRRKRFPSIIAIPASPGSMASGSFVYMGWNAAFIPGPNGGQQVGLPVEGFRAVTFASGGKVLVVPEDGIYEATFTMQWAANVNGARIAQISPIGKDGGYLQNTLSNTSPGVSGQDIMCQVKYHPIPLRAGEGFICVAWHNATVGLTIGGTGTPILGVRKVSDL